MCRFKSHVSIAGEAMFFESHLASLPHPTKRTLDAFRYHFFNCDSGSPYPTLGGQSSTLFDDADDLVALRAEDRDRLTAFLQDHCSRLWKVCSNSRSLLVSQADSPDTS